LTLFCGDIGSPDRQSLCRVGVCERFFCAFYYSPRMGSVFNRLYARLRGSARFSRRCYGIMAMQPDRLLPDMRKVGKRQYSFAPRALRSATVNLAWFFHLSGKTPPKSGAGVRMVIACSQLLTRCILAGYTIIVEKAARLCGRNCRNLRTFIG